jgi:hypothetical protein
MSSSRCGTPATKTSFEDYCAEADEMVRGYYGYKDIIEPEDD